MLEEVMLEVLFFYLIISRIW